MLFPIVDHRMGTAVWHLQNSEHVQRLNRRAAGGSTGTVQRMKLTLFRIPNHHEGIATDRAHMGIDNGEYGIGRDGGVERVSAGSQNLEPGHAGEIVRRRDHSLGRQRCRSTLQICPLSCVSDCWMPQVANRALGHLAATLYRLMAIDETLRSRQLVGLEMRFPLVLELRRARNAIRWST